MRPGLPIPVSIVSDGELDRLMALEGIDKEK